MYIGIWYKNKFIVDNTFLKRHISNKSPFQRMKHTSYPANLYRGSSPYANFIIANFITAILLSECHFWLILFHLSGVFFWYFYPKNCSNKIKYPKKGWEIDKILENPGNKTKVILKILIHNVKLQAVDRSTMQLWTVLAKGHST